MDTVFSSSTNILCQLFLAGRRVVFFFASLAIAWSVNATNHILRQDELMVGLNGDPSVQFIRITVSDGTQKAWGPGPGEGSSRAMLVFFNGAGVQTGQFFFPNNAPVGQNTVLIATTNFANLPGAPTPDFIIPPLLSPGSGKVCFRGNPANRNAFGVNLCLSYGNFPAGQTEGGGPPAPALPLTGEPMSLTRTTGFGFGGVTLNSHFALAPPTPVNTLGQTITFTIPGPEIDVVPALVNFGIRITNSGPSAPLGVVLTNRGVSNPLILTNIFLIGTHSNQFAIATDSGQAVLPTAAIRTVTVTFNPTSTGAKTAALRIVSNDENENFFDVALTGTGFDPNAPEISVTPASINFGLQNVTNGPTASTTVTLLNQGLIGSLFVTNFSLVGTDAAHFQLAGATNLSTVTPGNTRTISIAFDPFTAGPKSAVLRIISSDADEMETFITLQGRGLDLNPCTAPNPTNTVAQDLATNAMLICPDFVFTGSIQGATSDGFSSCGGNGVPDVWFRYAPAVNGMAEVTVTGTGFSPVVSAHRSLPGNQSNLAACGSPPVPSTTAQMNFPVTNGVLVFIRVGGLVGQSGAFQLTLTGPACFDFDRNRNGLTDSCEFDFGDAPAPYPTTLATNGARHGVFTGVFLGQLADSNDDGLPTLFATGDNEDGPTGNDEDGVTFTTPFVIGQTALLTVRASVPGALSAWIDFNADGDWADAGEQVFTNRMLSTGLNALALNVPNTSVATNLTLARFRFSTAMNLAATGAAPNGEVEDYALEILPASPTPGSLGVRFNEVMAGLNGDSTVQFVELEASTISNKSWGPQGAETAGRAMLVFFDPAGRQIGRFVFPSNAPAGQSTVLIATRAFVEATGLRPDFIMPPEVMPVAGKVAFRNNPDNSHFNFNIALSYGGNGYYGVTEGGGTANTNQLPILKAKSLTRVAVVPFGLNQNSAFQLTAPTPRNTAGQTVSMNTIPFAEQGRVVFFREPFRGNGRTCATCHVPGRDQFGLTPQTIAQLDEEDPLFVFEKNVNLLKLVARSQPSDLRGPVAGTLGAAQVLSGSGDTYLVIGATNFSGTVTDTNGNSGTVQLFTHGDLEGPTPSSGSERGLEDHDFLEHGRGLILENIDGFKRGEVFRASPHLLNLSLTAPFGLSGEFDNLEDFSDGAVVQHFSKSLARVRGVDFRNPTREELLAMSEFMFGISNPDTNRISLERLATTEAQKRGRAIFFNDQGRCAKCHSGPAFSLSDGTLPGSIADHNDNFNTGVANSLQNFFDNLPTEPAGLPNGQSSRNFNTPSLMNIRLTAPFFHDGSAATLKDAIKFYDSEEFHNSPAGDDVGSLLGANKSELVDDLVAFLESLVELPVEFTRVVSFGIHCPGGPLTGAQTATVTNISTNTITITNVVIAGTNAADFNIVGDTGQTNLAPGQTRSFQIAFAPATLGVKKATLEITALDTNLLGRFDFGVALDGADVDNLVQSTLTNINFGVRDIDAPPSPEESIVISNEGSTDLEITVEFTGANPGDFTLVAETNAIPAHGNRVLQVSFAPQTQGVKSALIRVRMISCTGTNIEIALAGVATSTVDHFAWDPLGTNLFVGTPFPVRLIAQDRNNETVAGFHGVVKLFSVLGAQTNVILISPTNSGPFLSGIWTGSVTVLQPATALRLLARDNPGHTGFSEFINVPLRDDVSLIVMAVPDPVLGGANITYTLTVSNTGPSTATGIVLTNQLPPQVNLLGASSSQGTVSQNGSLVVAELGNLSAVSAATLSIVVEPLPVAAVTNRAWVVRNELEAALTNNFATNTTLVGNFGLLTVSPASNFVATGFSGGPFTPTNQIYTLSNAGNASLNWSLRGGLCVLPPGLAAWWPLNGSTSDSVSTNAGTLQNGPVFTNGVSGGALFFDGVNDAMFIPATPGLDVGRSSGMSIELWINPADVSSQRPMVEWANSGVHFWISVGSSGGGVGSLFANLISVGGTSHQVSSVPGFVQAGIWQHVAMTYNTNSGVAKLFFNGVKVRELSIGSFVPQTATDLALGHRPGVSFTGLLDEVSIYNQELSEAEIGSIFASGSDGKCGLSSESSQCVTPTGLAAWFPLQGSTTSLVGTNTGTIIGNPVFTNGFVGQAMFFDGNNDGVQIPGLNLGTNDGLSFEAWFNVPDSGRRGPIFEWDELPASASGALFFLGVNGPGSFHANLVDTGFGSHAVNTGPGLFVSNVWNHVALTYSKASGVLRLYVNGVQVIQQSIGSFTPRTTGSVFLGHRPVTSAQETLQGFLDEPSFYDRELTAAEVQTVFANGASGKCPSGGWFGFSPTSGGTLASGASATVNLFLKSGATNLPIGSYNDRVRFTNTSTARGSTERFAQLNVINRRPTLAAFAPLVIAEDSGPRLVNFSGISAGGSNEVQQLTVTVLSDNPALITNPVVASYVSPATNGSFSFIPLTNAHGTAVVSVIVRDDGFNFSGGFDSVTNILLVTVTPVNDPPTLGVVPNQTVNEGALFVLTNNAADVDLPGDSLTFSLPVAPTNAVINPATGEITWTPDELQGGTTNLFRVVVADSGVPSLRATNQFTITVLEMNSPPALPVIGDRIVHDGTLVTISAAAADPDVPTNAVSYALGAGFPAGASINASNGLFTWPSSAALPPGTNSVTIIALDDGVPPAIDSKTFQIVVVARPRIETIQVEGTNVVMTWTAVPGLQYGVQFKTNLNTTNWSELPGGVTATNSSAGREDLRQPAQRFYQIRVIP
jgi:uncharacterized repeat protein (TIGR01451 family)